MVMGTVMVCERGGREIQKIFPKINGVWVVFYSCEKVSLFL